MNVIKIGVGQLVALLFVITTSNLGCAQKNVQPKEQTMFENQIAPLLDGMGDYHFAVSTEDTLAQRYFNQGLTLSYGFNHKEANRSFRQAGLLDPNNAMAWWGAALVLGPNINAGMFAENIPRAWEALQKAIDLKDNATQKEQDYIEALSFRYEENPPEDRTPLDEAYANAMKSLAEKYPDDLDAQTLYAEALMDLHPWNYWKGNGDPQPWTVEVMNILESVIERDPDHLGANHLYIHAVEDEDPEKGVTSANLLRKLVPGAGHLVHMPSHIYIRVGDYHEGTLANQRAAKADQLYVTQCRQQGVYPLAYVPHIHHFLWATATMEGRSKLSQKAAQRTSNLVDQKIMRQPGFGTLQHYWVIPLYDHVRFARWDKILLYPEPPKDLLYPRGVWHYARGMAYVGNGDLEQASEELSKLREIALDKKLEKVTIWNINSTHQLLQIATRVLEGEIEAEKRNYDQSVALLREAIAIEDQLSYNEPPDWFFPVRHNLGSILLKAERPEEAEEVYRKDLLKFPHNGWSLYGLWQSLRLQGKVDAASQMKKEFEKSWKYSDLSLKASRKL